MRGTTSSRAQGVLVNSVFARAGYVLDLSAYAPAMQDAMSELAKDAVQEPPNALLFLSVNQSFA